MLKRIVNITIWTIIGLYTIVIILLHIPFIQNFVGERVADALCQKFGTKVSIGRVDLGFINRLVVDDTKMLDQQGEQMLRAARISVKIDPLALAYGQIEVTSAQFFGLQANLYKATPEAKPNFQFVVDSLASKDTTKQKKPLDLQINSLIIRHGNIRWRILSRIDGTNKFSTSNIDTRNISAHLILNRITDDSINVKVKRIAFDERCGLSLKSLSMHAVIGNTGAHIENFRLELPSSVIKSRLIKATYRKKDGKIGMPTVQFDGIIDIPSLMPADFSGFMPQLGKLNDKFTAKAEFYGTGSSLTLRRFALSSANRQIRISAEGSVRNYPAQTAWSANVKELYIGKDAANPYIEAFTKKTAPEVLSRFGNIHFAGYAGGDKHDMAGNGKIATALGNITLALDKHADNLIGHVEATHFDIGQMLNSGKLGHLSLNINIKGQSKENFAAAGHIYDFDYNGYKYQDINIDASYFKKIINGKIDINDPNVQATLTGLLNNSGHEPLLNVTADINHLNPGTLHLTNKWKQAGFSANIVCDIKGSGINNADGTVEINNFAMHKPDTEYRINNVTVKTGFNGGTHYLNLNSDFGYVGINGHFNYSTVARSVLNMISSKLPTIPGLTRHPQSDHNDFNINASITDTEWMKQLLGIPLEIYRPLNISGNIDDHNDKIDLWCDMPSFSYNGSAYRDAFINVKSPGDTLMADIRIKKMAQKGKFLALRLNAGASDNRLKTSLMFSNNERHPLKGVLNASTVFAKNDDGISTAYVDVLESRATIGDTTWHIMPASITYSKNRLKVENFSVKHAGQYLTINGMATKSNADSLKVELNDIDVNYILNLVNFHSVDFFGMASGEAHVAAAFSGRPQLAADLQVKQFKFETGRMGTLYAHVGYNDEEGRIDINAAAKDDDNRRTYINGYVSPKHNYIDLGIDAHRTRAEFMESFCGSFMDNVDVDINGHVNVVGPLDNINLVGKAAVNGNLRLSSLNTTYWLHNDSITFVPDEIKFKGDTLYDHNGNIGIMTGSVYHQHLTNLSYDLNIKAKNLLAYDTHTFDGNTFYGTAYVTGDCGIKGRSGAVTIDIDAVPEKNSILVYNVSDQTSVGSRDFISWKQHSAEAADTIAADNDNSDNGNMVDIATDIRLNFLINCTPNATIKLLMDEKTGDYITLNGDGVLRATYFNKGSFDIYGNYIVDHGVYKLTIQNIIKKDFVFQKGGTISFGGDPYNAALNLKALYILNSVSLADLNIGRSFSNNNVRVNCLMNITGIPMAPKVDFDLDMPSMSNDVKQMVYSLLNADEEKNQQVLYLLAVGRFYAQGNNNSASDNAQYSQTSLAMQSFLSGTISQQINSVLSNVVNNSNWNFGANISTGAEGFNNAEYEGLLSGSMLNNRLLFNGQFGYRDNANATTSFIGDFDLKYLLFPNGNLAINVYNKTNDRYFTRNSLNTQGLGVIMKKDFTKLSDLFFWRKKKKENK